jgi:bilirubin oxidase
MTRLNVYAGPAGFYLLRSGSDDLPEGVLPGPAPRHGDAPGTKYYEIPLAIQDRSFNADGSLFYPSSREFFDGFAGPYVPDSDISPIWNPEFFGHTMLVNGKTWPYLEVEPRRYRFRLLNGCNSRTLLLKMTAVNASQEAKIPPAIWQIGTEGGFLAAPVERNELLLGPAERADVIVDFTAFEPGDTIRLINIGPDEPFKGGVPEIDFPPSDPDTTGQVMEMWVMPLASTDISTPPAQLQMPALKAFEAAGRTRQVSLNELDSMVLDVGPKAALLGTVSPEITGIPCMWSDSITETPLEGDTEIWEIYNFTMDAHPIHLHQVVFQVIDRQVFHVEHSMPSTVIPAPDWEKGLKDTVLAYPGQITRIQARFDLPGLYVWHCHIVEHEDNEMMRPLLVKYKQILPLIIK